MPAGEGPEHSLDCPRCGKFAIGCECTLENPCADCTDYRVSGAPHLHGWCIACGFKWIVNPEDRRFGSPPRCAACRTDLSGPLGEVPALLAARPFPFRCPGCLTLLLVRPADEGPEVSRFPRGDIERGPFESARDQEGADQAG